MVWQNCKCGYGLDEPTPEEVCAGEQECPSCRRQMDPLKTIGELMLELIGRIEALEKDSALKNGPVSEDVL